MTYTRETLRADQNAETERCPPEAPRRAMSETPTENSTRGWGEMQGAAARAPTGGLTPPATRPWRAIPTTEPDGPSPSGSETPPAKVDAKTGVLPPAAGEAEVRSRSASHGPDDLRFTDPLVCEIVETWRLRQDLLRARIRLELQAQAIIRRMCAGDKAEAGRVWKSAQNGRDHPLAEEAFLLVSPLLAAREPLSAAIKVREKELTRLAKRLPVAALAESVRGLGWLSLAGIAGECGDLSAYRSVSAVWKRAGLAVIDGGRQRRVTGEAALLHGYSPSRRSVFYVISDCMLRAQGSGDAAGPYRLIYDAAKATALSKEWTAGHAHAHGLRVMTKELLKRLTLEWRAQARNDGAGEEPKPTPSAPRQPCSVRGRRLPDAHKPRAADGAPLIDMEDQQ